MQSRLGGLGTTTEACVPSLCNERDSRILHDRIDACRISVEMVRIVAVVSRSFAFRASVWSASFCAGFGYVALYWSGEVDLFIAQSVFIVPAVLVSLLSIILKGWLLVRRVKHRRAALTAASSRRSMMRPALRMLAQRFVLQHDVHAHEELKSANDRHRYDGYCHMLGIATEA